jgi:hypothetical protein
MALPAYLGGWQTRRNGMLHRGAISRSSPHCKAVVEAGSSEKEIDEASAAVKAAEPSRRSGYTVVQRRHSLNICELGWNVVPARGIEPTAHIDRP